MNSENDFRRISSTAAPSRSAAVAVLEPALAPLHFIPNRLSSDQKYLALFAAGSGRLLCSELVLCNSFSRRLRGLLGKRSLLAQQGAVITPCCAIHTVGMAFAIDVVFVDRGGEIVYLVENLRPFRAAGEPGAHSVIELAAGSIQQHGLQIGQRLRLARHPGTAPGLAESRLIAYQAIHPNEKPS